MDREARGVKKNRPNVGTRRILAAGGNRRPSRLRPSRRGGSRGGAGRRRPRQVSRAARLLLHLGRIGSRLTEGPTVEAASSSRPPRVPPPWSASARSRFARTRSRHGARRARGLSLPGLDASPRAFSGSIGLGAGRGGAGLPPTLGRGSHLFSPETTGGDGP